MSAVFAVTTSLPSRNTVTRSEICSDSAPEIAHQMEEVHDLLGREAGGRLVEDDDAGFVVDGARDLHHLPLGGAEERHGQAGIDLEIQRLQQLLGLDVERAKARQQLLVAELDILRRRHGRHQARLLIDHGDAGAERIARPLEMRGHAVDIIVAGGELDRARDCLAQGRLPGAVLAHHGMHFAGIEIEIHTLDRMDAAIDLAAADHAQHRLSRRRHGGDAGCGRSFGHHRIVHVRTLLPPHPPSAARWAPPSPARGEGFLPPPGELPLPLRERVGVRGHSALRVRDELMRAPPATPARALSRR
jgi:hypothetical protein